MLDVRKPVIVGHSWGTLVALAAALDHPHDVAGLVLLSGYYFPSARPDVVLFSPPAIPGLGDILRFTASPLIGRVLAPSMFKAMFSPAPLPERFARWPVELAMRPSQLRAAAADTAMMIPAAALLQKRYGELHLPVTIMAGECDKIAYIDEQSCVLHQKLSNSELVPIPNEGHMFHYAAGESILAAIGRVFSRSGEVAEPSTAAADEIVPAPPVHSL